MQLKEAILRVDGKSYTITPGRPNFFETFYVDFNIEPLSDGAGERYSLFIHPKQNIRINRLALEFGAAFSPAARFFCNGYQSWSESRALPLEGEIKGVRRIARRKIGTSGDDLIPGIPRGRGRLHSWTYTYLSEPESESAVFWGSLNEKTAFTIFLYDHSSSSFTLYKDMSELDLSHSFPAIDVIRRTGKLSDSFDLWAGMLETGIPEKESGIGWTSWYRFFNKISPQILEEQLASVSDSELPFSCFQIDDGWQAKIGDWSAFAPGFSAATMADIAQNARAKGLSPGLWIAPFVAAADSEVFRRYPERFLKGADGKPLRAGWNPLWGGWYYAVDIYNPAAMEYLSGIFHLIFDRWGYEMIKADFLFAACLQPPPGKTRAQVMHDAMSFLRRQAGNRKILACGAPLGSCLGLVDYCRIGGDVHMQWRHRLLGFLRHRERVDTLASLHSTLGRFDLNGRVFLNDPDVFILREEGQTLNPNQQYTLLLINALLGGVLFTSDDPLRYSREQIAEIEGVLEYRHANILSVRETEPELYRIQFEKSGEQFVAGCNLGRRSISFEGLVLEGYESIVIKTH